MSKSQKETEPAEIIKDEQERKPFNPCARAASVVDDYYKHLAASKVNHLASCHPRPEECGCEVLKFPHAEPYISVSWGDSKCDCMETNDFEVLVVTVCNPYSNIAFENVMIGQITVTDEFGNPVATLPDGSPSVEVHPRGALCFGTIAPCQHGVPSCVSREIVLYNRGAKAGKYLLKFGPVCFTICYAGHSEACFVLNLCKD